ncbi:TPA: hypothetical protein DCG86_07315 [Candidatus Marinimicrobia bacterium]|nr:MAG: Cupin, RmlC-type [Marinimicrobia bacterium 46_47]HAE87817.1 hypothetical protein [Candidatus Neomarinimicrobiota bacterium]HBY18837.1 hypothetical protein [Candidatus Neomarinimicrobiota bacterium]
MNYDSQPGVQVKPITVESFKRFGQVVQLPKTRPTAEGETFSFWSDIAHYFIDGQTEIGLCTVTVPSGHQITGLERHLKTPEILIPIDAPFVLSLLLEGERVQELKVFRVNVGEAVVINRGVWHGPCIPLEKPKSTYFVIFRQKTPLDDVEKRSISGVIVNL